MKRLLTLVIALVACKQDDLDTHIDKVNKGRPSAVTDSLCALTRRLDHDHAGRVVQSRLRAIVSTGDYSERHVQDQLACIADGYASAPARIDAKLAADLLHAKLRAASPALDRLWDKLPEHVRRRELLAAMRGLATLSSEAKHGDTVAPLLVAELERIGGADDAHLAALVTAAARFSVASARAQLEKLGSDPRVTAAWRAQLREAAQGVRHGMDAALAAAFAELRARGVVLRDDELRMVLQACQYANDKLCTEFVQAHADRVSAIIERYQYEPWAQHITELSNKAAGRGRDLKTILRALAAAESRLPKQDTTWLDGGSPFKQADPQFAELVLAIDDLAALGKPAAKELRVCASSDALVISRACAYALAKVDVESLIAATSDQLAIYNEAFAKEGPRAYKKGHALASGLRALATQQSVRADELLLRSLSAFDPTLVDEVVTQIHGKFAVDRAVDGLFAFMANKQEFRASEIETYVRLVTKYGADASSPVARNLEAQLARHRDPTKVYWALKVVAMRALQAIGTAAAAPTVRKYAGDRDAYEHSQLRTASDGTTTVVKRSTVPFAQLATETLRIVERRRG